MEQKKLFEVEDFTTKNVITFEHVESVIGSGYENETVTIMSLQFFEHGEWRELKIPDDSTRDNRRCLDQIISQARKERHKILKNVLPIF